MNKLKIFMGSATVDGLPELEAEMNKWVEKEKAEVKNISISIREIPTEERPSLTAEITDQIIICLTYEKK